MVATATDRSVASAAERSLRAFHGDGEVVELRGLGVRGRKAVCEASADLAALARRASELDRDGAVGVYHTLNPLRPDLAGSRASCRAEDVVRRRWLPIDLDPLRPAGVSSADAELQAAWAALDRCRGILDGAGLAGALVGFSGNGWHLCYPIDLPADEPSRQLVRSVLAGLHDRCSDRLTPDEGALLKAGSPLPSHKARVDTSTFDAPRIWKLYGTTARKGESTKERPHRRAQLISGGAPEAGVPAANSRALESLLAGWRFAADVRRDRPASDLVARARAYVAKEPAAVSGQRGHDRAFHVVCVLVKGFGLTEPQALEAIQDWNARCEPPWTDAELRHKIADAAKQPGPVGQLAGERPPAQGPAPRASADTSGDPEDADATAADLVRANATVRWAWPGWLPQGVLSVLASEPGVGKTRFCCDLARRVHGGLPWPDGAAPTFPKGSTTLWVPADNQHAELGTIPAQFDFPAESLYLNATRRNPFAGTMLDEAEDLRDFEARVRRVKPAIVFIDTSLNATDRSSHKPEDAKAFFVPLQQIAARQGCVILCVTHLNAAGKPLGRRIQGQARLVMQLEKPDPAQEHRRSLRVVKSNSLYPPALGITMGAAGNEYDFDPPKAPEAGPGSPRDDPKVAQARDWLSDRLAAGPSRVSEARSAAEAKGFTTGTLYRAKDQLGVVEYQEGTRKWWRLPKLRVAEDGSYGPDVRTPFDDP